MKNVLLLICSLLISLGVSQAEYVNLRARTTGMRLRPREEKGIANGLLLGMGYVCLAFAFMQDVGMAFGSLHRV